MKILSFIFIALFCAPVHASCVILLHGLARTESSMQTLQTKLSSQGYQVVNLGYPSRDHKISVIAEKAIAPALEACKDSQEVSFVTHSLGGILVRQYLSTQEIPNLNYVVMLGPPNKGSEVVDKLRNVPGYSFINGKAGMQLGTEQTSTPNTLGAVNFNLGVIAGNKSINLILSTLIPGSDDGKVSIQSTKLEGMNDHIELPVTHTFMMKSEQVISQVIYYLENGKFDHASVAK